MTYCPDVCPTDLMAITQALDALGSAAEGVQPVFITIDPERDTKVVLVDYISAFHRSLIGLVDYHLAIEDQIRQLESDHL